MYMISTGTAIDSIQAGDRLVDRDRLDGHPWGRGYLQGKLQYVWESNGQNENMLGEITELKSLIKQEFHGIICLACPRFDNENVNYKIMEENVKTRNFCNKLISYNQNSIKN